MPVMRRGQERQSDQGPHLGVGHDLQGDGGQIEGVHDEVHEVPPVVDVVLEAAVPHLLDLCPDESWTDHRVTHTSLTLSIIPDC